MRRRSWDSLAHVTARKHTRPLILSRRITAIGAGWPGTSTNHSTGNASFRGDHSIPTRPGYSNVRSIRSSASQGPAPRLRRASGGGGGPIARPGEVVAHVDGAVRAVNGRDRPSPARAVLGLEPAEQRPPVLQRA